MSSIGFGDLRKRSRAPQKWLLLDMGYLAYRAFYTTGQLKHDGMGTGVIFGVLREIASLQELHNTQYIAFCFDHGKCLRKLECQDYKANRVQQEGYDEVRAQIKRMRKTLLPEAGFKNICYHKGYEADDIIASICRNLQPNQEAVIVTADHDMFQLLSPKVRIWNPNKKVTINLDSFHKEWGIEPEAWPDVKAIAGCKTDNIAGIQGVGEVTAAKFLKGTLNEDSKLFRAIVNGNKIWKKNRNLVALPYPGVKRFILKVDKVTTEKWNAVAKKLGAKTLEGLL